MPNLNSQRRLTVVLATDIAGYSRLVGLDEAGTHRRLKALRSEVLEHLVSERDGHIVQYSGDGALAEFSSVVNAVKCAVEIQQTVAEREPQVAPDRRLSLRIGLHVGEYSSMVTVFTATLST